MDELTFEFVQNYEVQDPFYRVSDIDEDYICLIEYDNGYWFAGKFSTRFSINEVYLSAIANKLDELNESTRNQRIFNWF